MAVLAAVWSSLNGNGVSQYAIVLSYVHDGRTYCTWVGAVDFKAVVLLLRRIKPQDEEGKNICLSVCLCLCVCVCVCVYVCCEPAAGDRGLFWLKANEAL